MNSKDVRYALLAARAELQTKLHAEVDVHERLSKLLQSANDGGRGDDSPVDEDEDLINVLYGEHVEPLLSFVLRIVNGDQDRARDVVRETLRQAWQKSHRLGSGGQQSLRPWLFAVGRRIATQDTFNLMKRKGLPIRRSGGDASGHHQTVLDALNMLSIEHRIILIHTCFRQSTVAESAERLGLDLEEAKELLYHATQAMQEALLKVEALQRV